MSRHTRNYEHTVLFLFISRNRGLTSGLYESLRTLGPVLGLPVTDKSVYSSIPR